MSRKLQIKKTFERLNTARHNKNQNLSQQINGNDLTYNFKKI